MFLVCDKTVSERAIKLREKIFAAGYLCAVARIADIAQFMPLVQIITFTDVFDDVRRTPYDNIRVLALGTTGFINSALNAVRIDNEDLLLEELERVLREYFHVQKDWIFQFGIYYDDGVFMAKDFFVVYANIIEPTDLEYRIFRYVQAVTRLCDYSPAMRICHFCYPYKKIPQTDEIAARNLSVIINHLNKKCMNVLGYNLIEGKRFKGYRLVKLY